MADEKYIRRRLWLRLVGSPWVVGPFLAGLTGLTGVLAFGGRIGFGLFAVLAGSLAAAGAFMTRLILSGERLARDITEESARLAQASAQQALDDLDRHLTQEDADPRPETALRDLRALLRAFDEAEASAGPVHLATVVEIRSRVNQLFEQCVQSLNQSGKLWATARQLNTPAARQPLLSQREKIISDVQATVKQLSDVLVGIQSLETGEGSGRQLARLRAELDQSLEVARTVEDRVAALLGDSAARDQSANLSMTPEPKG